MYAFEYQRPTSRDAAKAAASGADARYLAGGQSLIQAMRLGCRSRSASSISAPSPI
jgi:carbon-monoxide dehydrogenase medium subunit